VILFLVIDLACTYLALSFVNKPFTGFLFNPRMRVGSLGPLHWTGVQAGLIYPDKLLKANDVIIASKADLDKVVAAVPVGTPIRSRCLILNRRMPAVSGPIFLSPHTSAQLSCI